MKIKTFPGPCVDLEVNKIRGSARKIAVSEIIFLIKTSLL